MLKRLKSALPFVPALAIIGIVLPGAGTQTQKAPVAREEICAVDSICQRA